MTRVWLVLGTLAAVAAVGWGTFSVIGLVAHEEVTEAAIFRADGITRIDIDSDNGRVEVIGTDTDEIRLVAEISHGLRPTSHRAEVEGDALVVRARCPLWSMNWCTVDYRLEVPTDLDVDVDVDNGRIVVRDIAGTVHAEGDNESIELTRLAGDVEARTDNGSVVATGLRTDRVVADSDNGGVSLTFAEPPRSVAATTDHGSVRIVVPDGPETYRVDIRSDFGSADTGVRTDPDSDRVITGRSHNGSVTVRYPSG